MIAMASHHQKLLVLPASLRRLAFHTILLTPAIRPSSSLLHHATPRACATYNTNARAADAGHSSVNQDQVSHFDALAEDWWNPQGSSRLLHLMNPLRHRFIRSCLHSHYETPALHQGSMTFLDIGCGGGIFAESAARLPTAKSVTAIDPTPGCIAVAQSHQRHDPLLLQPGRLTYKNIAIEQLPLPASPGEGFDIISVFEVIEHIQFPSEFLDRVLPHLKPGGWLIGSTIARTNTSWFTTKFVAEDVLRMVPRGTHDWHQYIQPHELRDWARGRHELEVGVGGRGWQTMGVVYLPALGWKEVPRSEDWGNYFFGVRKLAEGEER